MENSNEPIKATIIEAGKTYTPIQLESILNAKEWTIKKWCREKEIPAKKIGGKWIIEGELLLNFLRNDKKERGRYI